MRATHWQVLPALLVLGTSLHGQPAGPTVSTIDADAQVGESASIAIGSDGLPLISYYDRANGDLKVAHCSDVACTAATLSRLDTAGNVGEFTALAIGTDGRGLIAYYDTTNHHLKVAHCSDVACTSAVTATLDSAGIVGLNPSIAIGTDGRGLIAYADSSNGDVKVAHCADVACTSAEVRRLDDGIGWLRDTAATIGSDGLPLVAYHLQLSSGYVLRVAHCEDIGCVGATRSTIITSNADGTFFDVAIAKGSDGLPLVTDSDVILPILRIHHCSDASCSTFSNTYVNTNSRSGNYHSVAIGADGLAVISFWDSGYSYPAQGPPSLDVAHCSNVACSATTFTKPVSASVASSSIAIGIDNLPIIALGDATATVLKVAHCGDAACSPPPPVPDISIGDVSVVEGQSGTSGAVFTITLSAATTTTVSVDYQSMDSTATTPSDYSSVAGTLSFAPGETTKTVSVQVVGDTTAEPNETFFVNLSGAVNGTITRGQGTATILDDDGGVTPAISIDDVTVVEGNSGTKNATFTVTLSSPTGLPVTVLDATGDGTATAGADYTARSGTLSFNPGQTSKTVMVPVIGDTAVEVDETFFVNLSSPSNATISRSQGQGTIQNDDVSVSSFTISPAVAAQAGTATLTWATTGATSVTISGVIGTLPPSGTTTVSFTNTTTYVLTATLSTASATARATVNVLPAPGVGLAMPQVTAPTAGAQFGVSGVTFTWNAVSGAAGYDIRIFDGNNGATVFSGSLNGGASTSTLISVPNGSYTFAVRACNAGVFSNSTCGSFGTVNFTVSLIAPSGAPTIIAPTAGANLTTSTQTFSWTSVTPNAALSTMTYEVLLRNLAVGTTTLQINVPHPSTSTIFSLPSSTSYELKVRACQAACGLYSAPVAFSVTLPAVPTTAPTITNATATGNSLTVDWTSVTNADLYQVQVVQPSGGPGGSPLTVAARQVSATTVTLPVPVGQTNVVVAACNGNGCGPLSAPASVTPTGSNPSAPNLAVPMAGSIVSGPTVTFAWSRIPGDTGSNTVYRLFVQDLSRQATALDVFTTNNFYAAYFKAEGARYDAVVIANPDANGAGNSGPSVGFNVSGTSSSAPTMVQPAHQSSVTQGNIQFGWSPVAGATLYEYFVAVQGQSAPTVTGVTTGLFVQVPLSAVGGSNTVYSGIVRACPAGATCVSGLYSGETAAGWGPWSNQAGPGVTNFTVTP